MSVAIGSGANMGLYRAQQAANGAQPMQRLSTGMRDDAAQGAKPKAAAPGAGAAQSSTIVSFSDAALNLQQTEAMFGKPGQGAAKLSVTSTELPLAGVTPGTSVLRLLS